MAPQRNPPGSDNPSTENSSSGVVPLDNGLPAQTLALPTNWPSDITYLPRSLYSSGIPPLQLSDLHTPPPSAADGSQIVPSHSLPSNPNPRLAIRQIQNPAHPAHNQHGLFAAADLAPETLVSIYTGVVYHSPETPSAESDGHRSSNYDLCLDRELGISIDAQVMGNEARFVNDYRGVPVVSSYRDGSVRRDAIVDGPNVEFREIWIRWSRRNRERLRIAEQEYQRHSQCQTETRQVSASAPQSSLARASSSHATHVRDADSLELANDEIIEDSVSVSNDNPWHGVFERCMALYVLSPGKKPRTRRSRGVKRGEELLVSYGKGFWKERT